MGNKQFRNGPLLNHAYLTGFGFVLVWWRLHVLSLLDQYVNFPRDFKDASRALYYLSGSQDPFQCATSPSGSPTHANTSATGNLARGFSRTAASPHWPSAAPETQSLQVNRASLPSSLLPRSHPLHQHRQTVQSASPLPGATL